jgi:hypothetical protein
VARLGLAKDKPPRRATPTVRMGIRFIETSLIGSRNIGQASAGCPQPWVKELLKSC